MEPSPNARKKKTYVAGHTGLIGSAIQRRWKARGRRQAIVAARSEVDLTETLAVEEWLRRAKPDEVIVAAGTVGGILANASAPASFLYDNLMIEANLIHGSWKTGVKRLLNFGSSCMYPKQCPQPMRPEHLMTGKMEPTSEPYAVAKWAGVSLCAAYNRQYGTRYISAIPCTVYGPGDSMDLDRGHVLSVLIRKLHEAQARGDREVVLWGSGAARREFIYVDDVAEACEILLDAYDGVEAVNVGSGEGRTIAELASLIAELVGYRGEIRWDRSKPDGAPEKMLDSTVIRSLGWSARTPLRTGLQRTYDWFLGRERRAATKEAPCVSS